MSVLKADKLYDTSGRIINGVAQVVQVGTGRPFYVNGQGYNNSSRWSEEYVDIPGLTLVIKPKSNTSRIVLIPSVSMTNGAGHGGIRIRRNNAVVDARGGKHVGSGAKWDSAVAGYYAIDGHTSRIDPGSSNNQESVFDWNYSTITYNTVYSHPNKGGAWVDYPMTSSTITYSIQAGCPYSSSYYIGINYCSHNTTDASWNGKTYSTFTAIELMGE